MVHIRKDSLVNDTVGAIDKSILVHPNLSFMTVPLDKRRSMPEQHRTGVVVQQPRSVVNASSHLENLKIAELTKAKMAPKDAAPKQPQMSSKEVTDSNTGSGQKPQSEVQSFNPMILIS